MKVDPRLFTPEKPRESFPGLTALFITYNEEHCIARAIESVKGQVDEIIILDANSTDKTKEAAEAHGAFVYKTHWRNSFSSLRNEALSLVSTEWVLFLDADQWIGSGNNWSGLRRILKNTQNGSDYPYGQSCRFALPVYSKSDDPIDDLFFSKDQLSEDMDIVWEERLFPRETRYYRPVEEVPVSPEEMSLPEEISFSFEEKWIDRQLHLSPAECRRIDFPIHHDGFTNAAISMKGDRKLDVYSNWIDKAESFWFFESLAKEAYRHKKYDLYKLSLNKLIELKGLSRGAKDSLTNITLKGSLLFSNTKDLAKFMTTDQAFMGNLAHSENADLLCNAIICATFIKSKFDRISWDGKKEKFEEIVDNALMRLSSLPSTGKDGKKSPRKVSLVRDLANDKFYDRVSIKTAKNENLDFQVGLSVQGALVKPLEDDFEFKNLSIVHSELSAVMNRRKQKSAVSTSGLSTKEVSIFEAFGTPFSPTSSKGVMKAKKIKESALTVRKAFNKQEKRSVV